MPKVAVASTDGITINEHFGKSKEFFVYEVDEQGEYQFLERRDNISQGENYSHSVTAELLADVEVVLALQIGPHAEQELKNKRVLALAIGGSVDKALRAYGKRGKFIRGNSTAISRSAAGCQPTGGRGSCDCSQRCR